MSITFQGGPPASAPLVRLNAGTSNPPIFMVHGIKADATQLRPLADNINLPNSIYGIEDPGSDGAGKPLTTIENKAKFYCEAIRKVQRRGPYLLVGYSLGGLVALEMSRRLFGGWDRASLLVMVDSYPPMLALRPAQLVQLIYRRMVRRATRKEGSPATSPVGMQSVDVASYSALKSYRPRYYDGRIKFVRAADPTAFPEDPAAVWAHLAADFEMETVPGDHVGIITTHVQGLASVVTRHLNGALSRQ